MSKSKTTPVRANGNDVTGKVGTISVESLIKNTDRLFLRSPCVLRSYAAGVECYFDRNIQDAEANLRKVFDAHFQRSADFGDIEEWVRWCMDASLPKSSETRQPKGDREPIFNDWLGVG